MSGAGEREQGKWAAAVAALLTENTIQDAAARVGIGESTLRAWLKRPKFLRLYRAARRSVIENVVGRLQRSADAAVATLERNMNCGNPAVENRAAVAVLEQAIRGVEMLDIDTRLTDIEQRLKPRAGEKPGPWSPPR